MCCWNLLKLNYATNFLLPLVHHILIDGQLSCVTRQLELTPLVTGHLHQLS